MAKVRTRWYETVHYEGVVEIPDEVYDGSSAQDEQLEAAIAEIGSVERDAMCISVTERVVEQATALRAETAVPADIKAPAYEPEF